MATPAIDHRLRELVAEQLAIDELEITPTAHFRDDLGADSLDQVELIMATEEAFHIAIDDDLADELVTFGQLLAHVQRATRAGARS